MTTRISMLISLNTLLQFIVDHEGDTGICWPSLFEVATAHHLQRLQALAATQIVAQLTTTQPQPTANLPAALYSLRPDTLHELLQQSEGILSVRLRKHASQRGSRLK